MSVHLCIHVMNVIHECVPEQTGVKDDFMLRDLWVRTW